MIIGITGPNKAGKGTLLQILKDNKSSQDSIIEDIGTREEVNQLRENPDSVLIAINAPQKVRYERALNHATVEEIGSFEDFENKEFQELMSKEPDKKDIIGCLAQADYLIGNESSLEDLEERFVRGKSGFIKLIKEGRRVSFDEKYTAAAQLATTRSTCLRRSVGAVIAKNNVFVSDGYNGAIRGAPHCIEIGECLRAQMGIPSGMRDEICRGVHAEANAILNAPTRESRENSTMYATTYPCSGCARLIANGGIKEVVYLSHYNSPETDKRFEESRIKSRFHTGVTPKSINKFWTPGVK